MDNILYKEYGNWILWVPVFIGSGILINLNLPCNPIIWPVYLCLLSVLVLSIFVSSIKRIFLITIILMLSGFVAVDVRIRNVYTPIINQETKIVNIKAKVDAIINKEKDVRLVLSHIESRNLEVTPKKIRLVVKTKIPSDLNVGDKIKTIAKLDKPPLPAIPYGYDFAKLSYFQSIGGIGYTLSKITIIDKAQERNWNHYIENIRKYIFDKFTRNMDFPNGDIASALTVGKRDSIDKQTIENIRKSGLAHLLAISGLHLSLVTGIIFASTRTIFASSESLTLNYNTKKFASFVAIIGGAFYLYLSGAPISAQRAFIMVSALLLGIMLDRQASPMRSIALAATIILLFEPESIIKPSFQMSFAAALGLIAGYDFTRRNSDIDEEKKYNFIFIPFRHVSSIIFSSLIASLATTIYTVYHFNYLSLSGIISNIVAIPVTTFLIMPAAILAIICMIFSESSIFLLLMEQGIKVIVYIAEKCASLPYAALYYESISGYTVLIITFGFLWVCLWSQKWRIYGFAIIAIGILYSFLFDYSPAILIDGSRKAVAIKELNGKLYFLSKQRRNFVNHSWLQRNGQDDQVLNYQDSPMNYINCNEYYCNYNKQEKSIIFAKKPIENINSDLIIYLYEDAQPNDNAITLEQLKNNGTCTIAIRNGKIIINNVKKSIGRRIWYGLDIH